MNRVGDTLIHFGGNETLVRALITNDVEFLVIGGLAMSWYCKERQADDMDLLIKPTEENSERLYEALSSLNLNGFSRKSFSRIGIQAPLKNGQFYAELLTPKEGGPSFEECSKNLVQGKLFGMPVNIVSITALIRLKQHAIDKHEGSSSDETLVKHREDIVRLRGHDVRAV